MEKRGNTFQDFFSEIMEKCHPSDFQRVRLWENDGDKKNDGYLRSGRVLFQVYAPNDMKASHAIVLAVLADLFEQCEIFERSPNEIII